MAESQNIEWKESWRDDYLKWICGFANAQGGRIYIGVDDTGKVVGVQNGKRLLEEIPNKIQTKLAAVSISDEQFSKLDSKAEDTALKIKIVEYLRNQPAATQKELQEAFNETRTHIQKNVKKLVNEGKIERKGGKRFGYWEIKK